MFNSLTSFEVKKSKVTSCGRDNWCTAVRLKLRVKFTTGPAQAQHGF